MRLEDIDLNSFSVEDVHTLRDLASTNIYDRKCPAWLRSGPSCVKEKEHDGPHEGVTHATLPNVGHDVQCRLLWDAEVSSVGNSG